eukprot:998271-Pelagomonas_calceolata.AAC.1
MACAHILLELPKMRTIDESVSRLLLLTLGSGAVHHKLTEAHRVASHNLTSHQIRVCQNIQCRQEV